MAQTSTASHAASFHRLGALTEAEIAAAGDATDADGAPTGEPPAVDLELTAAQDEAGRTLLLDALAGRRTQRRVPAEPLARDRLGWLLAHAARTGDDGRRPHPSAGAGYPLRLDVVALRCDDVPPGVHRYEPDAHGLRSITAGDRTDAVAAAFGRAWVRDARAVLVIGAVVAEATGEHGLRGYRYALLEAGHLAQNVLLLAAAADLPACPLGGFADRTLSELVGAAQGEVPLYAIAL